MSIEPVVASVWVPATPEAAFRRFTEELDTWWPRAGHSVSRSACVSVAFERGAVGAALFELDEDGVRHEWGRVTTWEPGRRLVTSWHPSRAPSEAQEVEVTFVSENDGTRVTLTHRGWEAIQEGAGAVRDTYAGGWSGVLAIYAGSLGGDE